ncbi:Cytochrome P450 [Klebsormidium nitens]|uniref:Cytochrome P450 n=1 Tax=Klebsormidium nitens TaxID=105231 RepID=A0A1Y1HRM9_KLENI|nr:Cytochrome P450 [Klebsormidium nitens]|eukprot:GAQ79651.1 Cytochrome P450 [Klebsormidium nitens]
MAEPLSAILFQANPVLLGASLLGTFLAVLVVCNVASQYAKFFTTVGIPPGPTPWPLVSSLGGLLVSPQHFDEWSLKMGRLYGGVFSIWNGGELVICATSQEAIKEVLFTKDKDFASRPPVSDRVAYTVGSKSIEMAPYGDYWRQVRKLSVVHLFSHKAVAGNTVVRQEETEALICNLKRECAEKGGFVEPRNHVARAMLNTMMRPLFGVRFGAPGECGFTPTGEALYECLQESFHQLGGFDWGAFLPRVLEPLFNRDVRKTAAMRDRELQAIIDARRAAKKLAGPAFVPTTVVDVLLSASNNKEQEVAQEPLPFLLDLLNGAVDTSGVSIEWILAEITRRPAIRRRLHAEIDEVVGRDRPVCEEDLKNMPYLRAVVKEHFRFQGVGPFLVPHMNEHESDDPGLQGTSKDHGAASHPGHLANLRNQINLIETPKSIKIDVHCTYPSQFYRTDVEFPHWQVLLHTRGISRDPAVFPRADEFLPERFLEDDVDITGKDIRVLPFGAGRRGCPGANQGLLIIQLAIGRILQTFDVELIDGQDISLEEESSGWALALKTPLRVKCTLRV